MTNPSQTSPSKLSDTQPELLYGNGRFLVRLWSLQPKQSVDLAPFIGQSARQGFLISGSLNLLGSSGVQPLTIGLHINTPESVGAYKLQNPGEVSASFLEIVQGADLPPVSLPEVTETRPWGSFTILKDEPDYKLKQLLNTPGNRLSLQRHQKREEHWVIIAGHPEITLDDNVYTLQAGDYIHIPLHSWHRLSNPAPNTDNVELIELQLGAYFGEDDIERRQDDYGRA